MPSRTDNQVTVRGDEKSLSAAGVGGHWCYQSQKYEQPHCEDPRQWHVTAATCKGNKQSPINIVTRNVVYDNSLKPLNFEGYDVKGSSKWNIENNGHTVKVTLSTSPKIGGGGLGRKYKAIEFHFHWGVQGVQQYLPGSEHSIDGEKQAMELHVVHIREDVSDITEAKKNADGVAVLAFFVKIEEENKNYATLINELENIKYKGQRAQMEPLPLSSLLPPEEDLGRYYRYKGSLTTPDCHEGVIWTVFEKPVELSISQISQFSTVHFDGKNSSYMVENFRPVQFLNERKVYWSSASILLPTTKVLMLLLMLTYILSSLFQ
ncbi:PREDICTED: carbonic anhydrase 4 [Haliaeetus leucocephalus]|uniref:carbonic anhydrase 4 n=1 Tax=Haliaeetus leucocephalus TaxID=52644 RepID=UPI000522857A|nr:PREDICTED: carbonic anhydrase 4 [Haliaeetus albicilla]XP_010572262.1 PREDICTED: carbonic anhydrase 4 [Haliaeetus leucocephalus]